MKILRQIVNKLRAPNAKSQGSQVLSALLGKNIIFYGKWNHWERQRLLELAEAQQGIVVETLDASVHYLVLADLAASATVQKKVTSLNARGATIHLLDADAFAKLVEPTQGQIIALIRGGKKNVAILQKALGPYSYGIPQQTPVGIIVSENFDGLDLSTFNFHKICFEKCSFVKADISHAQGIIATDCDFSGVRAEAAVFFDVAGSRFIGGSLNQSRFGGNIERTDFSHASMKGVQIIRPHMRARGPSSLPSQIKFTGASMASAHFHRLVANGVDFAEADLNSTVFDACELERANFRSAHLRKASLAVSKIVGADFGNADLTEADFSDSDLSQSIMSGADLDGANFFGANVNGADFTGAKNYSPQGIPIARSGPALNELDQLSQQARRICIQFQLQHGSDNPAAVRIDTAGLKHGWGINLPSHSTNLVRHRSANTVSLAMQFIVNRVGTCAVRYESLEVKSSKSPKTGKVLREIVMNALSEAFAQPIPPADVLAAATKAYRGVSQETQQVDRERLKKARELAAKQKETERKKIANQIAKRVGQVTDIATFLKALELRADKQKIDKATKMLKAERFKLFNDITDNYLSGVVKSQTDADLVYACRINKEGGYACCTQNMNICGGLRGSICKHLLVLIVGLVKAGELDPGTIDSWIAKTHSAKPELDKEVMGEIFLKYKGAEAGEIDWRPTETLPEDFYAV